MLFLFGVGIAFDMNENCPDGWRHFQGISILYVDAIGSDAVGLFVGESSEWKIIHFEFNEFAFVIQRDGDL